MMHPSAQSNDFEDEIEPLVSASSSAKPTSSNNLSGISSSRRCRKCFRSRCFIFCFVIAILALLSCFYVDEEAVSDLRARSSNFIRKKEDGTNDEFDNGTSEVESEPQDLSSKSISITHDYYEDEGDVDTNVPTLDDVSSDFSSVSDQGSNGGSFGMADDALKMELEETDDDVMDIDDNENSAANAIPEIKKFKQHLVLHVGPQKTGSTTLQTAWHMPQGLINDLRKDNYRYAFVNPHAGYFNCDVSSYGGYHDCEPSRRLRSVVRTAKAAGENLLLSDENLDSRYIQPLNKVIDRKHWQVTVVVVYRRIHEWLVSWYNQINKTTNRDIHGNVLFDNYGKPYRMNHKWWPDQGGSEIPVFSEWYKSFTKHFDRSDLVSRHRSVELVRAYRPVFDEVIVHNMHQEGDLVTNFMCDSVPDAIHCCSRLKRGALEIPRENASINLDHDIIAVGARKRGLLQKSLSRQEVHNAVSNFVKNKKPHIPRICDDKMIEEIREWLLGSEEVVFQTTWSDKKTVSLDQTFDSYIKNGKLCDVDLDAIFNDGVWTEFFASLDNRPTLILHAGPQKTGSSTLQRAWASPKELADLLKQDHFSYAKITPEKGMFDCKVEGSKRYSNCQATDKLLSTISEASNKGQHLLLSDENLNEVYVNTLRKAIKEKEFNAKVVIVYRRIHEWLFSWYNQINKSTNLDANGNYLMDEHGRLYREEHKLFPDQGGEYIPTFGAWYREFVQNGNSDDLTLRHPSIHFMNVYKPHFNHIEVFNMHQSGDLVTNFMCQMIPEAKSSCNALKTGVELPVENASVNLDHDIVAVAAYEKGLVRNDITRSILTAAVAFFVEKTGKELPRKCDDAIINQIRTWLIESEQYMYPDAWDEDQEAELEDIFDTYRTNGKLCDIDLSSILGDEEWIEYFDSMKLLDLGPIVGYEENKRVSDSPASSKNHLVLHVGPQKTGSSTLQSAWSIMRSEMDQDEYDYRHITPENKDFDCDVGRWGGFVNCKASDQLVSLIDSTHSAGRNLLLSDENLDERFAQSLRDVIDDNKWHVTVVVTYRRIHKWLVSWYNQINKTTNTDGNGKLLIDENGNPYREEHKYWPDQGGVKIPGFTKWYTEFTNNWDIQELVEKHRSVDFYHLYSELFDNVVIYDMHQEGDLVTNFMCDIIPRADHACLKLQNHDIELPKVNPSVNLDYDILSVNAYEMGYVDKSLSRKQVVESVGTYIKESGKRIPRACHPGISKQIYDWLVGSEEAMFVDNWSPKRNIEMTESFKSFFATGKMCDVDAEEAMRDQDWVNFFQSLGV